MGMYQELKNTPPPTLMPAQQGLLQGGQGTAPESAESGTQMQSEGQPQGGQEQPPQQAPQAAPQQEKRKRDYETEPLGEKDRDAFDLASAIGKRIIHDKDSGGREAILNQLQSGQRQDPKQIVPRVAAAVFKKVGNELQKSKVPIDPIVQALSIAKITKEVADLGEAAGLLPDLKTKDMKLMVADAIKQSMKAGNKKQSAKTLTKAMIERLPEEERAAAMQELRMVEATKSKTSKIPEGILGQEGTA